MPKGTRVATLSDGFAAVKQLDNTNVYGALLSVATLNIFKEGMWMKILPPYILVLAASREGRQELGPSPLSALEIVGATLSLYGLTRAIISVIASLLINRTGADFLFGLTGWLGLAGVAMNWFGLWLGSMEGVFLLVFVWGLFDGLWGCCLEVVWANSIIREKREDINWARQAMNSGTQALGPILCIFCFNFYGDQWSLPCMRAVMLIGTLLTSLPVLTCFLFHRKHEVRQEVKMCDIRALCFPDAEIVIKKLTKGDFVKLDRAETSNIKLTYPLGKQSKYAKIKIFTPDFGESHLIFGKQFRVRFRDVPLQDHKCLVDFEDPSREPAWVAVDTMSFFLNADHTVNLEGSSLVFHLYPDFTDGGLKSERSGPLLLEGASNLWGARYPQIKSAFSFGLQETLLPRGAPARLNSIESVQCVEDSNRETPAGLGRNASLVSSISERSLYRQTSTESEQGLPRGPSAPALAAPEKQGQKSKKYAPNLVTANIILFCNALDCLGAGLSSRFVDLFLIQVHLLSPSYVLSITFLQCCSGVLVTSVAQNLMAKSRIGGYHAKSSVIFIWLVSLFFLAFLCLPGVSLYAVVPAVVLMRSLNSSTKAYTQAKLVAHLPHDRIAMYMVWESLIKAGQGGIAIIGAVVIRHGGYHSCFTCTFIIMLFRVVVYAAYTRHRLAQKAASGEETDGDVGPTDGLVLPDQDIATATDLEEIEDPDSPRHVRKKPWGDGMKPIAEE